MNNTPVPTEQQSVLAIETSTVACSVAIQVGEKRDFIKQEVPRTHNQELLAMVSELLRRNGTSISALSAIYFGQGPGSFTGTRIAAAVTQGLALPFDIPVYAISSLHALAAVAVTEFSECSGIIGFIRSRPGEYYRGTYSVQGGVTHGFGDERICRVDDLYCDMNGKEFAVDKPADQERWLVVFDEVPDNYQKRKEHTLLLKRPDAAGLLAVPEVARQSVDIAGAIPVYLQGTSPWKKQTA